MAKEKSARNTRLTLAPLTPEQALVAATKVRPPAAEGDNVTKIELARRIDELIDAWLKQSGLDEAKPKEVMPMLIERGIFRSDHREGLPLRNLLRYLDRAGQLGVMRTVHAERKAQNTYWSFHPTPS